MKKTSSMHRIIPTTIASQHPDHAAIPFWHSKNAFISTLDECKEVFHTFSELKIQEYKWDWEGKYVDESIIERLYSNYGDFFTKNQLGKKFFLTFRLPNPKVETEFRLGRAFMGILAANELTNKIHTYSPALFEVILPMTESADEMIMIQQAFSEMAHLKHDLYRFSKETMKHIQVIPLFEQINTIINSDKIIDSYIKLHIKEFGHKPDYLRPYIARSDPALNSGLVSTILATKIALSRYRKYEEKNNISLYPILGCASLPFRGGLTPYSVEDFIKEYKGIKTVLIQSAFRYDYPKKDVIKAIKILHKKIPLQKSSIISPLEEMKLLKIIPLFEKNYKASIEHIAPLVNQIVQYLPKRRERVQHIGLFGYSRSVGKIKLPRAIGFTASLYSIGIPPELIGTGRGIKKIIENGDLKNLEKYYLNIKQDLTKAGVYVNKDVLKKLVTKSRYWKEIEQDIKNIELYLGHTLGPITPEEKQHYKLTSQIYNGLETQNIKKLMAYIEEAALIRKSLG